MQEHMLSLSHRHWIKKRIQTNKKKKEIFNRKTLPQEETCLFIKNCASSISS